MQQVNASPLKPPLGLPIPSSPADSGFLPRREFLPSSSKRPLSTFSLLTFTNTSSLRLAAFPQSVVNAFHRYLEERKLLRMFRENRSPMKDKDDIERDRGPEIRGFDRPEEEDLAEFTLTAKFWANPKTVETEKLMIQILILLNSLGYALLSSIDFAREPGDKLTLVFERPISSGSLTQSPGPQFGYQANGSTVSHQQPPPHSGSLPPISGNGVLQQIFGVSFTSQTSFRCICPPLESTPGVLQALRNAWPKGVEVENKVADGCYEFKLKGYAFFAEDTFQTDSLALILSLLKSLQRLQFTLIASISLSNSHARSKDLWLFSATDTETLSPHQLLNSISSSPASYTLGATIGSLLPNASLPSRQYSGEKDDKKLGSIGHHLRSASADANQSSSTIFAPGHQRHATTPNFGTNQGNTSSPSGTVSNKLAPRQQGSVLVKKSSRTSTKPTPSGGLPFADSNVTPPGAMGRTNTPPKNTTPPGASTSPFPGSSTSKPGAMTGLPAIAPKPTAPKHQFQQQQQQVLYSTPTSGNVLYSTPPSSPPNPYGNIAPSSSMTPQYMPSSSLPAPFVAPGPPPGHPNVNITAPSPPASPPPDNNVRSSSPQRLPPRPNAIDMPSTSFNKDENEGDGPTPPLLSSATFRDTMLDHDRDTVLSGRSGESFEVPVMWTGGLSGVGLGPTLEEKEEEEEEESREGVVSISSSVPAVPGGWVEESSNSTPKPRTTKDSGRPSKEKERTFDAKFDGAQIVNVVPPEHDLTAGGTTVVGGGGTNELHRRKSQEAVVHTLPGAGGSGDPKKDGWVMVNVSGDQQKNKPSPVSRRTNATTTTTATATANVSFPEATSSTPPATSSIIAPPAPPFLNDTRGSGSGEESSSSHDRRDKDASATKPGSTTTTSKRSGFRRLFSRGDKDKYKDKEGDKGSEKVSPDSAPGVKKLRWGPVTTEPAGGVRRSTID